MSLVGPNESCAKYDYPKILIYSLKHTYTYVYSPIFLSLVKMFLVTYIYLTKEKVGIKLIFRKPCYFSWLCYIALLIVFHVRYAVFLFPPLPPCILLWTERNIQQQKAVIARVVFCTKKIKHILRVECRRAISFQNHQHAKCNTKSNF